MLLGISDDLSNKRILLVTTKVITCLYDAKISWCALIRRVLIMYREIVLRGANLQDELVTQEIISSVDCFKRVDLWGI